MTADSSGEKTIALVAYPGLTALDLVGPLQVLTERSDRRSAPVDPSRRHSPGR